MTQALDDSVGLRRANAELQEKLDQRTAERDEALAQQLATAEILQVINASPGELAPVFAAMLERAVRLCEFDFATLWTYDGSAFRPVARHRVPEGFWRYMQDHTPPLVTKMASGERLVHIADLQQAGFYETDFGRDVERLGLDTVRSVLVVSLRREDTLLGAIVAYRREVRPFSDKQIALLENFAAQAVIAMENARLITETREALEQQTATAEVLGVINSSPGDLAPVFDAILEKAIRLCDAAYGHFRTYDGERFPLVSVRGDPQTVELMQNHASLAPAPYHPAARFMQGEDVIHFADAAQTDFYREDARFRGLVDSGACRAMLSLALRKDRALLGYITVYRNVSGAFSDKQIALVKNFAAQAVIAMENARLITETREALDQQTATTEVLEVINSSPGDLEPVFEAMLEKAMRLCEAPFGVMLRFQDARFTVAASRDVPAPFHDYLRSVDYQPQGGVMLARLQSGAPYVHTINMKDDDAYRSGAPLRRAAVDLAGARHGLFVSLRKDRELLGTFNLWRTEVRPFTDKQIALLQNFAAQAVIAMENARLITETREALEQQTATAEVLQVINSSPGDLGPVFDTMLDKATRLCEAAFGIMNTYDGNQLRTVALRGAPPLLVEFFSQSSVPPPEPDSPPGRIINGEDVVQIEDLRVAERARGPRGQAMVDLGGARSFVVVALRKDGRLMGSIAAYRQEVRPFTDKQIRLLRGFAAQAVIAMENARLITETREALEQQTATAEVLGVINNSPGDLKPVFDAMLEKALRLCEVDIGTLWIYDGEMVHPAAIRGAPPQLTEFLTKGPYRPAKPQQRVLSGGERLVQIADITATEAYRDHDPIPRAIADLGGVRTLLIVPLRKDNVVLGNFAIYRCEVRAFTEKQIALLESFAAQAVIAMENARLITETREALAQQTATAEVLGVINSSPGDLAPVFDAMLEKATRLCTATYGQLAIYDGEVFRFVAAHGEAPFTAELSSEPHPPSHGVTWLRIIDGENVVHIPDVRNTDLYRSGHLQTQQFVENGGGRSLLSVGLRKDNLLLGVLSIYRQEPRPFSVKEIALLENFAAQAVIAMENARLITETREALAQQTATAEVLGVINSSPGDLAPVFDAMLEKATRLCDAALGVLSTITDEKLVTHRAFCGPPAVAEFLRERPANRPGPGTTMARLIEGENCVHVLDATTEDVYHRGDPARRAMVDLASARTILGIALRKDDTLLGAITLYRQEVRAFSEKEIALLENFAAQAVIVMENARLLTETREARDDAEVALRDLRAAQANLVQAEKMASLGQLTAGIAHDEIKNPLNFVNNFAGLSVELLDELKETTAPAVATLGEVKRAEVDETIEMLTGNLEKIVEHGQRADGIVKSMLEHSRGGIGERRSVDLNGLIEEALNLAYHGARAQDQSFNITLEREFGQSIVPIELVPQDITRVCLNLFGNGFYAATKRQKEGADPKFTPILKVATRDTGGGIEVRVRDNGVGIPAEIKDKLFQPFFTTKPTGEGTGLGLSISYDIVTQQHGGTITVDSRVGEFTEFTIRLPRSFQAIASGTTA